MAEGAFLEEALIGKEVASPLDPFMLLAQESFDLRKPHKVDLRAVSVDIIDEQGRLIKSLTQGGDNSFVNQGVNKYYFQLSFQGKVFSKFRLPIRSVGIAKNKVVFVRDTKSSGVKDVRFIDLVYNKPYIGKMDLVVFRTKAVELERPRYSFDVSRNGDFHIAGNTTSSALLNQLSQAQQVYFNISVSLADVKNLAEAEPLIEDLSHYTEKAVHLAGKNIQAAQERTELIHSSLESVSDSIQSDINKGVQARVGAIKAATVGEVFQQKFLVEQQGRVDQIGKEMVAERGNQRKLLNRINDDGRIYLTQTRIDGALVIRFQAGAFTATAEDVAMAYDVITELAEANV